jgi:TPR repeat protein
LGHQQNQLKGLEMLKKSANLGNKNSQIKLGEFTNQPIDPSEEAEYYRHEIIRGNYYYSFSYSMILCFGYGTTQNVIDAIFWAKRSKMRNNVHFTLTMNEFHQKSTLGLKQKQLAVTMAEGIGFEFGIECKQSYSKAFRKYLSGAEGGVSSAMVVVAKMHRIGVGTKYDLRESRKWLLRAADLGNFHAIREIGLGYEFGEDFEFHKEKAMEWYWLGIENGDCESSRLWLRQWLDYKSHWIYRKGTRTCKLNREFYDRNLLLKYLYFQTNHHETDLLNFPEEFYLPWELIYSGEYFHELSDDELLEYLSE